jgi:hypothetical protein
MITPTININGSSKSDLLQPRLWAMRHLDDAIEALQRATPNGRDYPGNNTACIADREEHYDRLAKLRALREELMAEAVYIKEQGE